MYYADEPRRVKTNRLPMSKLVRTAGLITGVLSPVAALGVLLSVARLIPNVLIPILSISDLAILAICLINPVTRGRKIACVVIAAVMCIAIIALLFIQISGLLYSL